jgi:hypothetical protein
MKDPEPEEPACPACGSPGDAVGRPTLEAQLAPEDAAALTGAVFACPGAECRTAYFNAWQAAVGVDRLRSPASPKVAGAPICPCLRLTEDDVVADARAGRKERIREVRERPEEACVGRTIDGRPCLPRVLRLYRESMG